MPVVEASSAAVTPGRSRTIARIASRLAPGAARRRRRAAEASRRPGRWPSGARGGESVPAPRPLAVRGAGRSALLVKGRQRALQSLALLVGSTRCVLTYADLFKNAVEQIVSHSRRILPD